jgi:hypothetical protein
VSGRHHFPTTRDLQPLQLFVCPVSPIPKSVVYSSTSGGIEFANLQSMLCKKRRMATDPMFGLHRKGEENTNKINKAVFDGDQIPKRGVSSKWVAFSLDYYFVVDCHGVEGHQGQICGPALARSNSGYLACFLASTGGCSRMRWLSFRTPDNSAFASACIFLRLRAPFRLPPNDNRAEVRMAPLPFLVRTVTPA